MILAFTGNSGCGRSHLLRCLVSKMTDLSLPLQYFSFESYAHVLRKYGIGVTEAEDPYTYTGAEESSILTLPVATALYPSLHKKLSLLLADYDTRDGHLLIEIPYLFETLQYKPLPAHLMCKLTIVSVECSMSVRSRRIMKQGRAISPSMVHSLDNWTTTPDYKSRRSNLVVDLTTDFSTSRGVTQLLQLLG